jgi:hypothetical protein
MIVTLLHVLPYQGYRPDDVDLTSGRMQLSSHICVWEGNPFTCRTLTGVRTVLPRRPDGCIWMLDSSQTLKSVRTRCCYVQTEASLNNLNLLDIDGRSDAWLGRSDGNLEFDFSVLESAQHLPRTSWNTFLEWRLWKIRRPSIWQQLYKIVILSNRMQPTQTNTKTRWVHSPSKGECPHPF